MGFKKRKIRSLFLASDKEEVCKEDLENELTAKGLEYIQMKLPIEKISHEFEKRLKEKVDRNILNAKIREASESDLNSVINLHNRAWMTSNEPFSPLTLESLKNLFKYPKIKVLIARVYGIDAGFVILDFEGPNNEYGIIAGLGVLTRFQRKGLGTIIGMAAWNYFKITGIKELRCEVYKDNKVSYNFIKSLGFEEFDIKIYKCEDFEISKD